MFQETFVLHLPPLKSDHRSLLVTYRLSRLANMQRRPFRFLTGWINHEDFEGLMHREWRNELTSWNSNLYHLKEALKVWNRDVFGNIFVRKKYLLRQLCRIEREMACRWSQELEFDQRLVWKEY
jgi:hypothetical protein